MIRSHVNIRIAAERGLCRRCRIHARRQRRDSLLVEDRYSREIPKPVRVQQSLTPRRSPSRSLPNTRRSGFSSFEVELPAARSDQSVAKEASRPERKPRWFDTTGILRPPDPKYLRIVDSTSEIWRSGVPRPSNLSCLTTATKQRGSSCTAPTAQASSVGPTTPTQSASHGAIGNPPLQGWETINLLSLLTRRA